MPSWCFVSALHSVNRRTVLAIPVLLMLAFATVAQSHLVSFEEPHLLGYPAIATDSAFVATDGAGTWITVAANAADLVIERSTDDGVNWDPQISLADPGLLGTGAAYSNATLASGGAGTWVVAYNSGGGPFGFSDLDLFVRTSVDNGATWTPTAAVEATATTDITNQIGHDLDVAGSTWIAAYCSINGGGDFPLMVSRSVDAGATWSVPVSPGQMNTGHCGPFFASNDLLRGSRLAGDGTGNWVLVWNTTGFDIVVSRSTDDGVTWTAPSPLSSSGYNPDVAVDRTTGEWVAVWSDNDELSGSPAGPVGSDRDIFSSRSTDAGLSWSSPVPVNSNAVTDVANGLDDRHPVVGVDDTGTWMVVWESPSIPKQTESDDDLFYATSRDGGQSWRDLVLLNREGTSDNSLSTSPAYAADEDFFAVAGAAGTWLTIESFSILNFPSTRVRRSTVDCMATAPTGCLGAGTGNVRIKIRATPTTNDTFQWSLKRGDAFGAAELGDPTTTSDYIVCVYDETGGVEQLVFETKARAGGLCLNSKPCWKAKSSGFSYKDARVQRGAINKMTLKQGPAGKAQVKLKARGLGVDLAPMPFQAAPSLRTYVVNAETGACWEGVFSLPKRNEADRYQAKSD